MKFGFLIQWIFGDREWTCDKSLGIERTMLFDHMKERLTILMSALSFAILIYCVRFVFFVSFDLVDMEIAFVEIVDGVYSLNVDVGLGGMV